MLIIRNSSITAERWKKVAARRRICLLAGILLSAIAAAPANADWPQVLGAGISRGNYSEGTILEEKYVWSAESPYEEMVAWIWMKVEGYGPGFEGGAPRYYYKVREVSPDGTYDQTLGPYGFDTKGYGTLYRQVNTYLMRPTGPARQIPYGIWKIYFYLWDAQTNAQVQAGELKFELEERSRADLEQPTPPRESPAPITPPVQSRDRGAQPVRETPSGGILFEDDFRRPDSSSVGLHWKEYTMRSGATRQEDSLWSIRDGRLYFEVVGDNSYTEDFVETAETFPIENVRIEFEMRARVGTALGYVGPNVFLIGDGLHRRSSLNVSQGPGPIGVTASYRWENGGTKGLVVALGSNKYSDFPDRTMAGVNQDSFARHSVTIQSGYIVYEAGHASPIRLQLAEPLQPGARRHLSFGARAYDSGVRQVIEVQNVKVVSLAGGSVPQTEIAGIVESRKTGSIATGQRVDLGTHSIGVEGGTIAIHRSGDPLDGLQIEVPRGAYPDEKPFNLSYRPVQGHIDGCVSHYTILHFISPNTGDAVR